LFTDISANKKPGREAGLFASPDDGSAEDAGRVDDAGRREQPNGDQNKFHDPPPRRRQYTPRARVAAIAPVACRQSALLGGTGIDTHGLVCRDGLKKAR
jgi:hypothetical protein